MTYRGLKKRSEGKMGNLTIASFLSFSSSSSSYYVFSFSLSIYSFLLNYLE